MRRGQVTLSGLDLALTKYFAGNCEQDPWSIPDLGEAPMEAAILVHVHPLGPSFRPGGGQALPLPTVNLPTLYSLLLMIALEIHHQLN